VREKIRILSDNLSKNRNDVGFVLQLGGEMMQRIALTLALVCTAAGVADAQNISTFNPRIYVAPAVNPVQMGNQVLWQSMAVHQQFENQRLRMEIESERSRRDIEDSAGEIGAAIEHACDPDALRRPGLHLLARLGLCGQKRHRVMQERGPIARREPKLRNGPRSVFDR